MTGTLTRPLGEFRFESGVPGGSNWKRWKNYLRLNHDQVWLQLCDTPPIIIHLISIDSMLFNSSFISASLNLPWFFLHRYLDHDVIHFNTRSLVYIYLQPVAHDSIPSIVFSLSFKLFRTMIFLPIEEFYFIDLITNGYITENQTNRLHWKYIFHFIRILHECYTYIHTYIIIFIIFNICINT